MPRNLRILITNLIKLSLKLKDTKKSQKLKKKLSQLLRRRRKLTLRNSKPIRTNVKKPDHQLLFQVLKSMMLPLLLRTKENTKFKSQTWRTFLLDPTNKLSLKDKKPKRFWQTTPWLLPNTSNKLLLPTSKSLIQRPELLELKKFKELSQLDWRKFHNLLQDQPSLLEKKLNCKKKKKKSKLKLRHNKTLLTLKQRTLLDMKPVLLP